MPFHEVLFPVGIAYGASGGPKFKTAVFTSDSGFEQRTLDWKDVRAEYEVSHTVKTEAEREDLLNFFMCRRGMAYGFRFKDWNDYQLRQAVIGYGDGVETEFQIVKRYTSNRGMGESWTYDRKITKIAWGTLAGVTVAGAVAARSTAANWSDVGSNPLAYRLDENTGKLTFRNPPSGYQYDGVAASTTFVPSSGMDVVSSSSNYALMCVDFQQGLLHLRSSTGLRSFSATDGAETLARTNAEIAFPQTSPSDNQQVSDLIAAASGFVYVGVGGSGTRVLYKLAATDYAIAAANGVAGAGNPPAGAIGGQGYPGAVSRAGALLMTVNSVASDHSYNVFSTADLSFVYTAPFGTLTSGQLGPVCPYFDHAFAVVLHKSTGLELWDDAGNLLVSFGANGNRAVWAAWDAGADPGVLIGWRDTSSTSSPGHITKVSAETMTIAWTINLPELPACNPQASVADAFWLSIDARLYRIDTTDGTLRTRACVAPALDTQAFDSAREQIVTFPGTGTGSNGRFISTDVAGVELLEQAEIKIGYGEFHVPVRFDTDHLDISHDSYSTSSWSGIELIEVRDWEEIDL